jgi:fructose-bisphosphate aldolase class II
MMAEESDDGGICRDLRIGQLLNSKRRNKMALVNMKEMLEKAKERGYAVGNFDVLSSEMLRGVLLAAEEARAPVILAYGEVFEPVCPMRAFAPMLRAAAEEASVPVVIHLDHSRSVEYIKKALDNGFTSVMIDSSDKPFQENIEITKAVVELCKPFSVSVESELGHVGGLEGYSYGTEGQDAEEGLTRVSEAVEFAGATGIDALAVAIGTVHGVYRSKPRLNLKRLMELKEAVATPLVMHGGSGLSDDDFRSAIRFGITKTNIFTDLTLAAMKSMEKSAGKDYLPRCLDVISAVKDEALRKMELFGSAQKG